MSKQRDRIKLAQMYLRDAGHDPGAIDGQWGGRSEAAWRSWSGKDQVDGHGDLKPPASDFNSVCQVFGSPCHPENLERFELPYPMRLAWDTSTTVTHSTAHAKVVPFLRSALADIVDHYGMAKVRQLGLDLFGGIYNCRKSRGGYSISKHSWGIAIDLDPDHNGNRVPWQDGKQGQPGFATMPTKVIEIFEDHGFKSGARAWQRDAMHFQFTK